MVRDYRAWLQSELQLLEKSPQSDFSRGQAAMARRAMERLDAELGDATVLELDPQTADAVSEELDVLAQAEALPDALVDLLRLIRTNRQ